jgi:hypothetical protein
MLKKYRYWHLAWILALPTLVWGQIFSSSQPFSSTQYGEKRDSFGAQWNANTSTGGLRSTTPSTGYREAATLRVNNMQFSASGPTTTADDSNYVVAGNAAGVQITRRVKLDLQNGIARLLDTFQNDGNAPANLSVNLMTSMWSSISAGITETGKTFSNTTQVMLDQQDSGFMVTSSSSGMSAILFYLVDRQAKVRPAIQSSGNSINITYTLTVPPKKSVSLLYGIGQRQSSGFPSADTAGGVFKLFHSRDFFRDIPAELRKTVVNISTIMSSNLPSKALLQPMMELTNKWNIERGKTDILVLDNDTTLSGTVSGGDLAVSTRFGPAKIPLDSVSALAGGGEAQRAARVFLRNGEILTGDIEAKDFVFRADNGLAIQLDARKLAALFMHTDPADGNSSPETIALVEANWGTRLAVQAKSPLVFEVATAWGTLSVPLADIDRLYKIREPQPIHRLVLKDKSQLPVILRGGELALSTIRFGTVKMMPAEIVSVYAGQREPEKASDPNETDDRPDAIGAPHFLLLDENVIVGSFDNATIELMTGAGVTPIKTSTLQNMEKAAEHDTSFRLTFADGSRLTGRPLVPTVSMRTTHGVLEAPLSHIFSFRNEEAKSNLKATDEGNPPSGSKPSPAKPPGARSPLDNMFGSPGGPAKSSAGGPF